MWLKTLNNCVFNCTAFFFSSLYWPKYILSQVGETEETSPVSTCFYYKLTCTHWTLAKLVIWGDSTWHSKQRILAWQYGKQIINTGVALLYLNVIWFVNLLRFPPFIGVLILVFTCSYYRSMLWVSFKKSKLIGR